MIGKAVVFWITSRMKAKREQVDEELRVIKLFASNYARDLMASTIVHAVILQMIWLLEYRLPV